MWVYSLLSSLKIHHLTLHFFPGLSTCSFVCHFNSTESIESCSISAHEFIVHIAIVVLPGTHFLPWSSEAFEGEMPRTRIHHRNNVPRLRGEKHDISLKIMHPAGLETERQAATLAKHHALTIVPCPYLKDIFEKLLRIKVYMSIVTDDMMHFKICMYLTRYPYSKPFLRPSWIIVHSWSGILGDYKYVFRIFSE